MWGLQEHDTMPGFAVLMLHGGNYTQHQNHEAVPLHSPNNKNKTNPSSQFPNPASYVGLGSGTMSYLVSGAKGPSKQIVTATIPPT